MTREYRRELKTLAAAEREATKPLRDLVKKHTAFLKLYRRQFKHADRILTREIALSEKAVEKIRARRAILQGRLS